MDEVTSLEQEQIQGRQQVERFVWRFDPSYQRLAYYAALPLILTPELLNYLRNQLLREVRVPWVAEVDLLLSDLCRPVGYEQYAMDSGVRSYLLSQMEQELGKERIETVAKLLIAYVRQLAKTNPYLSRQELQTQQWAAMVYLDTEHVVRQVASAYQQAVMGEDREDLSGASRAELARISRITKELAPQLRKYPNLLEYAAVVGQVLIDPTQVAPQALGQSYEVLEGLELRVPDGLRFYAALEQQLEYFQWKILDDFIQQENQFELPLHRRELEGELEIEDIVMAEDEEMSVQIVERSLTEASEYSVSFQLSVRIKFSVVITYDLESYEPLIIEGEIVPATLPSSERLCPNQAVDAVAEVNLWFSEEDANEVEPELVDLRIAQPILINLSLAEENFSALIPPLQTFEFEMATIAFAESPSPGIVLEPFEFEIVTIARQNRSTVQPTTELRFDHFLRTLEEEIAAETGHGFNDLEREVLTGALQGKSYKEIHREVSFIGYDHLMRNVGPKLWDRLSEATGEQVTKKNLLILCQQWLSLRKETDWRDLSQQLEDWQPNQFNLEELLDAVNGAILQLTDTTLNNEQQAILVGSLQGMTYKEIRARFGLSASVTRLTGIGNNLWKLLSNATGEQVTKDDLRGSLKQWLNRQEEGEALTFERQQGQSQQFIEDLGNGVTLEMVQIPGGSFVMGSPKNEAERRENESPQHPVSLTGFFMGKYAVTQAQWQAVAAMPQVNQALNPDTSRFKGNQRPVETVSWHDAVEFCNRLSHHTGKQYRLPSEAEWEYACRASPVASAGSFRAGEAVGSGTSTPFHFGETITPELANYNGDYTYGSGPKGVYRAETTVVRSFPANAFGLHDMHGNVREWCLDHWHGTYEDAPTNGSAWINLDAETDASRVLRGGSWRSNPRYCRSASRNINNPGFDYDSNGFRVVCAAPSTL